MFVLFVRFFPFKFQSESGTIFRRIRMTRDNMKVAFDVENFLTLVWADIAIFDSAYMDFFFMEPEP